VGITLLEVFLFIHVLLFVYWLGADLGVYYTSRFVVDRKLSTETRAITGKIMEFVDLSPRICLVLFLPSGISLMALYDQVPSIVADNKYLIILAAWLAGLIWLYLVIRNYHSHGDPKAAIIKKTDLTIRYLIVTSIFASAIYVLFVDEPFGITTNPKWLAIKVMFYATAIAGGVGIRKALVPFGPAFGKVLAGTQTEADNDALSLSLKKAIPWVHLIWFCVLAAAFLGITKPGAVL